jgi:DNA repair exonuclease SbcCD nuclease subunit
MEPIRFLHTAAGQMGLWRHFLHPEAQARFTADRIDAIRRIGALANEVHAGFVVVAGDVFESNLLDRATIRRALDAMAEARAHFYLLPGNHDPLQPGAILGSELFAEGRPPNVEVLADSEPRHPTAEVEVVGVPWHSKRPPLDLVGAACLRLEPMAAGARVVVAHGAVDRLNPDPNAPAMIELAAVERALGERRLTYLALGDRHSTTSVGASGAVWYSGAQEPTDFDEVDPGNVLLVELAGDRPRVSAHRVGTWSFREQRFDLNQASDLERVRHWLQSQPAKERTVLRLSFVGTVSIQLRAELEAALDDSREVFAGIQVQQSRTDLAVAPDGDDFSDLGLSGFSAAACEQLRARAAAGDPAAADALSLLFRLARTSP